MKRIFNPDGRVRLIAILALMLIIAVLPACLMQVQAQNASPTPTPTPPGVFPPPASFPPIPTSTPEFASPYPSIPAPGVTPSNVSPQPSAPPPSAVPSPAPSAPAPTGPFIKIVSPQNGSKPAAGDIGVITEVSNFNLVDKIGQPNAPGEGHIIYYYDVVPPAVQNAEATAKPDTFAVTSGTVVIWKNIPGGLHSFTAELVNNDNTPLNPPVTTGVIVQVQSPRSVTIDLIAQNITFNLSVITVPAGALVTLNFYNNDPGIPHNVDISGVGGGVKFGIFTGHAITGVSKIVYKFNAPVLPGTYRYQCDFHIYQMYGSFIVTP